MQNYNDFDRNAHNRIAEMQRQRNHDKLVEEAKLNKTGWFARLLGRTQNVRSSGTSAPEMRSEVICDPRTAKART